MWWGYQCLVVGLSGLEPETSALSVPRSNQLSYSPVMDRLSCVEYNALNLVTHDHTR